jgi:mannose-6-phosphate isomerase-like protein (cupin superfamily)
MTEAINIDTVMDAVADQWAPRILAAVNDYDVKVANVGGDFLEHVHDDTDEFFLVLAGRFRIELPTQTVELGVGDVFTVPRGVRHKPSADEGTRILMFEPRGTPNTGDAATGREVRLVDQPDRRCRRTSRVAVSR